MINRAEEHMELHVQAFLSGPDKIACIPIWTRQDKNWMPAFLQDQIGMPAILIEPDKNLLFSFFLELLSWKQLS